jgi:hypothetical protein
VATGQQYEFSKLNALIAFLRYDGTEAPLADERAVPGPADGAEASTAGPAEPDGLHGYQDFWQAPLVSVFPKARAYPQLASLSMREAADLEGDESLAGAARRLLSVAAPAALYALLPSVNYPHSYEQLVDRVNTALATGERARMLALADELGPMNRRRTRGSAGP